MSKIFLSCVFLVVCINFLKVDADVGLLRNPFGSLLNHARERLDNGRDQLRDSYGNVVEHGKENLRDVGKRADKLRTELEKRATDRLQRLKDMGERVMKQLSSDGSCVKLYNDGLTTVTELASTFNACFMNRTRSMNVRNLMDLVKKLQKILPEQIQNVAQCFEKPSNIASCLNEALNNVGPLGEVILDIIRAIPEMYLLLPNIILPCVQKVSFQFTQYYMIPIAREAAMCFDSVMRSARTNLLS